MKFTQLGSEKSDSEGIRQSYKAIQNFNECYTAATRTEMRCFRQYYDAH